MEGDVKCAKCGRKLKFRLIIDKHERFFKIYKNCACGYIVGKRVS